MSGKVKLFLQDFGPIAETEVTFDKYTIFIGEQGTGKSTIVKLFSLFTWLEKGLTRRIVSETSLTQHARFRKNYCAYHRLDTYFRKSTKIRFEGLSYRFLYADEIFSIEEKIHETTYNVAKVMYVPAERNFLSTTDNAANLKNLPESLQTFLDEFEKAKVVLKSGFRLPFNQVNFEYDLLNKMAWLKGEDYKIRLSVASSGFQSALPLLLVTRFLSDLVAGNAGREELSSKERLQIEKEVNRVMNDNSLSDDVKNIMLRSISSRFKYSRFVNIVEEMEQNLYPESQMNVLFDLLSHTNRMESNLLLLTTHSPYVINYLTLATKAFDLKQRSTGNEDFLHMIDKVVPLESTVQPDLLRIYELKAGRVTPLKNQDGLPSDENFLNNQLERTNEMFDRLLEVEETLDHQN